MRLKPFASAPTNGTPSWQAYTTSRQQSFELDAEGPLSDSPLSATSPEIIAATKGKGSAKKGDASRKRAQSDLSSDATGNAGPPAKKKKSAAIIIDSDDGGDTPAAGSKKKDKSGGKKDKDKDGEKPPGPLKGRKMRKGEPYDPNRHCGVPNDETGKPCGRSLTCKTHSMGAKRSVVGRSAPYDILLHEWQKLHNPNFGDRKVVTPRVGPGIPAGGTKKAKKAAAQQAALDGSKADDGDGGASGGLTTWDESIYGELDVDFLPTPPNGLSRGVVPAAGGGKKGSGSKDEGQATVVLEEAEDSDDEADLVLRAVAASGGGKPLVEGPTHAMGGLWMNRWNRFGRWGTREAYKEAFRLGAGGGASSTAAGAFGIGR